MLFSINDLLRAALPVDHRSYKIDPALYLRIKDLSIGLTLERQTAQSVSNKAKVVFMISGF